MVGVGGWGVGVLVGAGVGVLVGPGVGVGSGWLGVLVILTRSTLASSVEFDILARKRRLKLGMR